jgi:hypothetical protein
MAADAIDSSHRQHRRPPAVTATAAGTIDRGWELVGGRKSAAAARQSNLHPQGSGGSQQAAGSGTGIDAKRALRPAAKPPVRRIPPATPIAVGKQGRILTVSLRMPLGRI